MHEMIGIMADSHGNPEAIKKAITLLQHKGCSTIYHLGDICDSLDTASVESCIRILIKERVLSIKGNNDHAILAGLSGNPVKAISLASLKYLDELPLQREYREAIFVHSLPFVRELGLSCMVRALDGGSVQRFFNRFPDRILFRGHSHGPEMVWKGRKHKEQTPVPLNQEVRLTDRIPCIITCGAITHGICSVWRPEQMTLSCYSI